MAWVCRIPQFPFTWPVQAYSKPPPFAPRNQNTCASPSLPRTLAPIFCNPACFLIPTPFLINHSNTAPVHHCLCKSSPVKES
jgi:hypothetical protein